MKKAILLLVLCLFLTGCGIQAPEKAADGTPWDAGWDNVGGLLGVEPGEGWALNRSEDVLAAEGTFYNVWVKGDTFTYPGAEDTVVTAYEGQIHLVILQRGTAQEAQEQADQWEALIRERYPDAAGTDGSFGGQSFLLSDYSYPAGDRMLSGASATAVRGSLAVHVDVICADGTAQAVLADFLSRCHWA